MAALATTRLVAESYLCEGDVTTEHKEKVTEFLREAEKIKRQIGKVEKERTLGAQCKKNGWVDWFGELEDYEKVLLEHRDAEKMTLEKELVKIRQGVRKFQRQLTDVTPAPESIEKLKEIMAVVEISISAFKENQHLRFEELIKEERVCFQEIVSYDKKMENWPLIIKADLRPAPSAPFKGGKVSNQNLPSEVQALESFLQKTGGPFGDWDQYDHQTFLKVWTKHGGRPALRKEARFYLPDKSLEEVEQHEDWYRELISLQDKKREAIQRWKASRLRQRQGKIQRQEEEEETRRREEAKSQAQQYRAEEERREAAQRLEEWKEEKRRREQQEERQRLAHEIHQRWRAKEERRRQLEVKLIVEEQLRLKREEEEGRERKRREEEEQAIEERRREATMGIKRYQGRDLHKVETKLQEKHLKEQQEVERQKRNAARIKQKVEGHISRDPSRLTRPTKGWEERLKNIGPSGGGAVLQMFHRAVPAWRQGL